MSLQKNKDTNVVINTDIGRYEQIKFAREKDKTIKQKLAKLENEIKKIKEHLGIT